MDQQEFNNILKEEKIKKKKYEIRNQLEEYYHKENLKAQDKEENRRKSRNSYLRYKEEDKREYDIIDLKSRPFMDYQKKMMSKTHAEGWDKIVKGAGNNNTLKSKSLFPVTILYLLSFISAFLGGPLKNLSLLNEKVFCNLLFLTFLLGDFLAILFLLLNNLSSSILGKLDKILFRLILNLSNRGSISE